MPKGPQLNLNYFVDNAHILKNEKNVFNSQNSHFRSHFFGFNSLKTCVVHVQSQVGRHNVSTSCCQPIAIVSSLTLTIAAHVPRFLLVISAWPVVAYFKDFAILNDWIFEIIQGCEI